MNALPWDNLRWVAQKVLEKALQKRMLLAFAESCTGGLISALITDIPGASGAFCGSVVSYCDKAKRELLGVSAGTLEQQGAVSEACAMEMAVGALEHFEAHCALSVTGIAGPGGGSKEKPVGTVWIGVADYRGRKEAYHYRFQELERAKIRSASAREALTLAVRYIENIYIAVQ